MLAAAPAEAQTASVQIDLNRHIARVGEEVQVTVKISVAGQGGYDQYLPPRFEGFKLTASGMTSQNIEIINFRVRRRENHIYNIMPLNEGMHSVGPAAIRVGGRLIRSSVVKLKVLKGSAPAPAPAPGPGMDRAEPSSGRPQPVLITATATPRKVYLGQQVFAAWHLLTKSDVLGFQSAKQPTTDGFWSEDLNSPRRLQFDRVNYRGQPYYSAVLVRKALFPQQTGKVIIGPMEARVRTLDQFISASNLRRSQELAIEVMPLPRQGRPTNFQVGNVGQYHIFASLDRTTVKGGDAVTLKVVVRGQGNLRQLKLPPLKKINGFKVYEPKVSERLDTEGKISGEKIWEYLLLPVRGGALRVPPIPLSTFDPIAGRYRRLRSRPLSLTVTGHVPQAQRPKKDAASNIIDRTIRPPRPAAALSKGSRAGLLGTQLFWVLLVIPAALVGLITGGGRLRAHLTRQTPRRQQRAAFRQIKDNIKRAREALSSGDKGAFFGEIAAALRNLLDHKLQIHVDGLTRDELRQELLEQGFEADLVEALCQELDNCDFARFAPSASGDQQMKETLARTRGILDRLTRASAIKGGAS